MKRRSALAVTPLVSLVLAVSVAACAEASGDVSGGEVLITPKPAAYRGCDVTESIDAGSGDRWSDLFRDLFAANAPGACASAACHGSDDGEGFKKSSFRCDNDKDKCREGFLAYGLVFVPADVANPADANLFRYVRHCDDSRETVGSMPKSPDTYFFSKASIARMQAWIAKGAPND
jgi:hypothetical protein